MLEEVRKPNPRPVGTVLVESGYHQIAKQPSRILKSKGFQEILAEVDDENIIKKWNKWALSDKDKRVAMEAGKEIMKLKGRYPKEVIDLELSAKRKELIEG